MLAEPVFYSFFRGCLVIVFGCIDLPTLEWYICVAVQSHHDQISQTTTTGPQPTQNTSYHICDDPQTPIIHEIVDPELSRQWKIDITRKRKNVINPTLTLFGKSYMKNRSGPRTLINCFFDFLKVSSSMTTCQKKHRRHTVARTRCVRCKTRLAVEMPVAIPRDSEDYEDWILV